MIKTTQELIGEIRGLVGKRVDTASREEVLDEMRSHFDESIGARLELGLSPEAAEEEVVASFGDPVEFVKKMIERHPPKRNQWFDKNVWRSIITTTIFLSTFVVPVTQRADRMVGLNTVCAVGSMVLALWILRASWLAKKPQLLPLLANALLAIPLFASGWSLIDLPDRDFSVALGPTRQVVEKQLGALSGKERSVDESETNFNAAVDKYYFHPTAGSVPMEPYWSPSRDGVGRKLQVEQSISAKRAKMRWEQEIPVFYQEVATKRQMIARDSVNLDEKLDRPFWINAIYHLPLGAFLSFAWCGMMAVGSLGAWFLRQLWTQISKLSLPTRRTTA